VPLSHAGRRAPFLGSRQTFQPKVTYSAVLMSEQTIEFRCDPYYIVLQDVPHGTRRQEKR